MINLSKYFKDKSGKVVLGQFPNKPLLIAIGFWFVKYIPFESSELVSFWGVAISLIYWSILEIISGVNTWRRFLGLLVFTNFAIKIVKAVLS